MQGGQGLVTMVAERTKRATKEAVKGLYHAASYALPNTRLFNRLYIIPRFVAWHKRLPAHPSRPHADFNDFVYFHMLKTRRTALERLCADKLMAKVMAQGMCPGLKAPATREILNVQDISMDDLRLRCAAYAGQKVVVKPTHSSGQVLLLKHGLPDESTLKSFWAMAQKNFFYLARETQYKNLKKRIVFEEDLSWEERLPYDYKFYCAGGTPLFLQIDAGRFGDHRREVYELPNYTLLDVDFGKPRPQILTERPKNLDMMLEMVKKLAKHFSFVRVDLYDTPNGIYFGEFTFSPGATIECYSKPEYANFVGQTLWQHMPHNQGREAVRRRDGDAPQGTFTPQTAGFAPGFGTKPGYAGPLSGAAA